MVGSSRLETDSSKTPAPKNWQALEKDVEENPSERLIDRARKFGVRPSAIHYKKAKHPAEKKELRYRERNREERMNYYRRLRELIKIYGSQSLVFIDESGFEAEPTCIYAWAKKGKKVFGDRTGKRGKRENLIAARRKGERNLIAPMLLTGSVQAAGAGELVVYVFITGARSTFNINYGSRPNSSKKSN